jgi:predicted RNA binding protein YcfA (HicA-like mRNA interferase family)
VPRLTPIHWRRLVCVFEREGFTVVRQEGSHVVMTKPGSARPIVIPHYREVPVFVIRNNLRTGSISRERFFALLSEC